MNFNTIAQVEAAETKELIAFYNQQNPEKPVKKFADRQTAVKRVSALVQELNGEVETEVKGNVETIPAEAVSPEVKGEEKPFVWPYGEGRPEALNVESESKSDEKKSKITVAAAALLRAIVGSSEPVDEIGNEVEPEFEGRIWARAVSILSNAPMRSALKVLVIAGLVEQNGIEGEKSAVALTDKGREAYQALPEGYGVKQDTKKPISSASNAAGVAASWADPAVHAARLTRDGVTVKVDGKVTTHKSTRDAFRFYRLMDSKHIRFRGILKAAKTAVYTEGKKEYEFSIVAVNKTTQFAK